MTDQQKYTAKLANTHCLLIGGSSGIGFAVAEALLEAGAIVMISSSNPARIAKAVSRLQEAYPSKKSQVSGHTCDLSNETTMESNIKNLLDEVTENNTKKLDHVVHTAGDAIKFSSMQDASFESIKEGGMVRFFSVLLLGKFVASYMTPGNASSLTLTTGTVSQKPIAGWTIGGAYAAGLHGIMRGFALDFKPLRVNLISPGAVITELWDPVPKEMADGMIKELLSKAPTGKIAKPEDIAEAYIYAMKDQNVTGSVISTNSGHLLV